MGLDSRTRRVAADSADLARLVEGVLHSRVHQADEAPDPLRANSRAAASLPERTTSGTLTPSYAAPATSMKGSPASCSRIARTRSRCPGAYCGMASRQRTILAYRGS